MHTAMHTASFVPLWVPAVFVGLLVAGAAQARTRVVDPRTTAIVALSLFVFSLWGITRAFGLQPAPLLAWATGIAASLAAGGRVFVPGGLARVGERVRVPGSWLPLALMMAIFTVKTVLGFAVALQLPLARDPWFAGAAALALGLASGGFAARALALHRFAARHGAIVPAAAPAAAV